MPKNITSEVRDIILKVKEFMDEEKRMQVPIIPLSKVYVRVSAATGECPLLKLVQITLQRHCAFFFIRRVLLSRSP